MDDPVLAVVFYGLAALTLGSALGVVMTRNLFHAALFLVVSFLGVVGLYLTLAADFLAAVQLLIYAGAIAILLIFAIMLTRESVRANVENRQWPSAVIIAVLVFVLVGTVVLWTQWPVSAAQPVFPTINALAEALFNQYVLPFEIASVLLLAAMIGALVLAGGGER